VIGTRLGAAPNDHLTPATHQIFTGLPGAKGILAVDGTLGP
jgi:hypothetical protein